MVAGFYNDSEWLVLPHPGISLPVLLVVENGLRAAWDLLRKEPREGFNVLTAHEDAITLELHEALFDRVFNKGLVAGFDSALLSTVEREPKIRSYDYQHPDKMPDLLVRLVGRPPGIRNTQDGLFIECKPVDSGHRVLAHYCKKGLTRFILGEYAWAMPNAMMVGYTKGDCTVPTKLVPVLQTWPEGALSGVPAAQVRSSANPIEDLVYVTTHARAFRYPETSERAPEIAIHHVWLRCD